MPVVWNMKLWLANNRNIFRASELQALVEEKTGISISVQSISALMNGQPSAIRFQTMQVICNALDCEITEFFNIVPDSQEEQQKQHKAAAGAAPTKLYGNKEQPKQSSSIYPSPKDFRKRRSS